MIGRKNNTRSKPSPEQDGQSSVSTAVSAQPVNLGGWCWILTGIHAVESMGRAALLQRPLLNAYSTANHNTTNA